MIAKERRCVLKLLLSDELSNIAKKNVCGYTSFEETNVQSFQKLPKTENVTNVTNMHMKIKFQFSTRTKKLTRGTLPSVSGKNKSTFFGVTRV